MFNAIANRISATQPQDNGWKKGLPWLYYENPKDWILEKPEMKG